MYQSHKDPGTTATWTQHVWAWLHVHPRERLIVNINARANIVSQSEARERGFKGEAEVEVIIFSCAETCVVLLAIVQIGSLFQFHFQIEYYERQRFSGLKRSSPTADPPVPESTKDI